MFDDSVPKDQLFADQPAKHKRVHKAVFLTIAAVCAVGGMVTAAVSSAMAGAAILGVMSLLAAATAFYWPASR